MKFYSLVEIDCNTEAQAKEVMANRIGCDEAYGFSYWLDWTEPSENVPTYWPVDVPTTTPGSVSN